MLRARNPAEGGCDEPSERLADYGGHADHLIETTMNSARLLIPALLETLAGHVVRVIDGDTVVAIP